MPDGMCYVMLGRSERLEDIYIKCSEEMDMTAIRCDDTALEESKRLEKIFELDAFEKKEKRANHWKISYVNIQSLNAHYEDALIDNELNDSDIFGLGETHLHETHFINFEGFIGHFANVGKGKGQAAFTKMKLLSEPENVASDTCSAIFLRTIHFNIIFLYLSKNYNKNSVFTLLENWMKESTPTVVMGDVNENILENSKFEKFMKTKGFHQIIEKATYIDGSIIDHLYINELMQKRNCFHEQYSNYYSGHDAISLYIPK